MRWSKKDRRVASEGERFGGYRPYRSRRIALWPVERADSGGVVLYVPFLLLRMRWRCREAGVRGGGGVVEAPRHCYTKALALEYFKLAESSAGIPEAPYLVLAMRWCDGGGG